MQTGSFVGMQPSHVLFQQMLMAGMCMQTAASNSSNLVLQPRMLVYACLMCAGLHVWPQEHRPRALPSSGGQTMAHTGLQALMQDPIIL